MWILLVEIELRLIDQTFCQTRVLRTKVEACGGELAACAGADVDILRSDCLFVEVFVVLDLNRSLGDLGTRWSEGHSFTTGRAALQVPLSITVPQNVCIVNSICKSINNLTTATLAVKLGAFC